MVPQISRRARQAYSINKHGGHPTPRGSPQDVEPRLSVDLIMFKVLSAERTPSKRFENLLHAGVPLVCFWSSNEGNEFLVPLEESHGYGVKTGVSQRSTSIVCNE